MSIAENVVRVTERVASAAHRAGVSGEEITIVAVSKTFGVEAVEQAISAGISHIGENRVQEAEKKLPLVEAPCTKHMVGHLQTNKAAKALKLFNVIQSVDSLRLAGKLDAVGAEHVKMLVEVNSSGEPAKSGFSPDELEDALARISDETAIEISGLMTVGPLIGGEKETQEAFRATRRLFESAASLNLPRISMVTLSMGMTGDFETAIEEGSNMVRIGRAIFGERT